ncbi:MAG TPA: MBL fold metallo-hydrolase [Candidatus Paceibacterota bacterium]
MIINVSEKKGIKCQIGDLAVLVDPEKKASSTVVLFTKTNWPAEWTEGDIINGQGEYEASGVRIKGILLEKESSSKLMKTAYIVVMDDIKMCFLGEVSNDLDDVVLDKIGEVDILFMAIGKPSIDVKKAVAIIKQIEPKMIIPTNMSHIKDLASELGQKTIKEDKLVIKKKDIETVNSKLIWIAGE